LADTFEILGDEFLARGETAAAIEAYLKFFAIAEELAFREPNNRDRQLAMTVSNWKLAFMGDNTVGRFEQVVRCLENLKNEGKLDPYQLEWLSEAARTLAQLNGSRFVGDTPNK